MSTPEKCLPGWSKLATFPPPPSVKDGDRSPYGWRGFPYGSEGEIGELERIRRGKIMATRKMSEVYCVLVGEEVGAAPTGTTGLIGGSVDLAASGRLPAVSTTCSAR